MEEEKLPDVADQFPEYSQDLEEWSSGQGHHRLDKQERVYKDEQQEQQNPRTSSLIVSQSARLLQQGLLQQQQQ